MNAIEQAKAELLRRQAQAEMQRRQSAPLTYSPQTAGQFTGQGGQVSGSPFDPVTFDPTPVTRIADNVVGLDNGVMSAGEQIGTAMNKGGESMSLGIVGDEAAGAFDAAMGRGGYGERRDFYRQQERDLRDQNPALSIGAEIGGAILGPGLGVNALAKGASRVPRIAASAAATGTGAAIYGAAEGEGGIGPRVEQGLEAGKWGAGFGAAIPIVGAGLQRAGDGVLQRLMTKRMMKNAPSTDELRAAGNAAYRQVDEAGAQIRPEAFARKMDDIRGNLRTEGLDELPGPGSLTPNTARAMQIGDEMSAKMAQDPTAALPFSSLDQFRRQAGAAAANISNKVDSRLGSRTVNELDDFVQQMGPDDLVAGDAEALKTAITKARDTWSRMSRSQTIDDAITASDDYLSGSASGLRNQFKRIVSNPRLSRGFSDTEIGMMRRVIRGTIPEQLLNLAGGGLGQLATIGAGAGLGGPVGAVLGAGLAAGSRKASEAVTKRNAEIVRAVVANGGMPNPAQFNPQITALGQQLMDRLGRVAPQNTMTPQ